MNAQDRKRAIDASALEPVGSDLGEQAGRMKREVLEDGQYVLGTDLRTETWYHEETGTTSNLPVINHEYYARKRDFHPQPTKKWWEKNKNNVDCPVDGCFVKTIRVNIPFSEDSVRKTAELLGVDLNVNTNEMRRIAVLHHYQVFHPDIFASLLRQGIVTQDLAKQIRMGT